MGRLSQTAVLNALRRVRAMDIQKKAQLIDEVHRDQPNMLAAALVLKQLGVPWRR